MVKYVLLGCKRQIEFSAVNKGQMEVRQIIISYFAYMETKCK